MILNVEKRAISLQEIIDESLKDCDTYDTLHFKFNISDDMFE